MLVADASERQRRGGRGEQLKDQWEHRPGGGKAMGGGNPGEWADVGGESSEAEGRRKFGSGGSGQHRQVLLCLRKKEDTCWILHVGNAKCFKTRKFILEFIKVTHQKGKKSYTSQHVKRKFDEL